MEKIGDIVQHDINYAFEEQSLVEGKAIRKFEAFQINIDGARDILMRGLHHFIGEKAVWLPEYEHVAEWLEDNQGKGLFCFGNCGRGKTVLTAKVIPCIIHYWARKIVKCYTAEEVGKDIDVARRLKLIGIDDVGTEGIVNIYGNKIYALPVVIDEAAMNGNLLLLSTNMSFDDIRNKYGERTADRIVEICKPVLFRGESLRRGMAD